VAWLALRQVDKLGDALGYVQLAMPVRFRAGWEQTANLRLRAGDTSVLVEYDRHGRIQPFVRTSNALWTEALDMEAAD
jgi:hypothetical protein